MNLWEAARSAPIAAAPASLPASPLRGSSSPRGQLPVPSPATTQLPPHRAQRGAPQPGRSLGAARSFPGAGGQDGVLGGANWGPGACTIVDARGLVTLAPAAPGVRPLRVLLGAGLGYRADPAPAAPTPGARSLGSPQRRRRASAPRPSARFLFLPRESARTTRPGRAAAPGSPGQAVSGLGGRAGSGGRGGAADSPLYCP